MPVEADVVAFAAVAVDDGHVDKAALVEPQYHDSENGLETATGLPPPKGATVLGAAGLRAPLGVLCKSAVPSIDFPGTEISGV